MKKNIIILSFFLMSSVWLLSSDIPAHAQDAPNINVTKRRPDRPAGFSPTPVPTLQPVEIKQVTTTNPSFFGRLWLSLKSFFANFFK